MDGGGSCEKSIMQRARVTAKILVVTSLVGLAFQLAGCTTPASNMPATATPVTKNRLLEEGSADKQVEEARRMIEAGDYNVVIPRLLQVIQKYPYSDASMDARYWLAVTYYNIKSYRDAINLFEEYLHSSPHGRYAEESAQRIAELRKEYTQEFGSPEQLDTKIGELWEKVKQEPANYKLKWELADLLWKRGDYDMAGELYANIIEKYPTYATDVRLKDRIEFKPDGSYTLLTPEEKEKRAIEQEPLVITNLNDFRAGTDVGAAERSYYRQQNYYVVTGQAHNRGDSVLYGVQVNVTVYGFGNMIYDTSTVNIGRLNPGESRAFVVRSSIFDDIENVTRYEAVGTFQR